jgi:two-component system LytT family sensor kinase
VPSFVLQPLIENAIRHGMSDPARVLRVTVRAEADGEGLRLTVADDGTGLGAGDARDGLGLGTTRARLAGLYGGRASLTLGGGDDGRGTRVVIDLPADAPA